MLGLRSSKITIPAIMEHLFVITCPACGTLEDVFSERHALHLVLARHEFGQKPITSFDCGFYRVVASLDLLVDRPAKRVEPLGKRSIWYGKLLRYACCARCLRRKG